MIDADWYCRDWLARRANISPNKEAVVSPSKGVSLSYQEFHRIVEDRAKHLVQHLNNTAHIGCLSNLPLSFAIDLFAGIRAGKTVIPLNPTRPKEVLLSQLELVDAQSVMYNTTTNEIATSLAENGQITGIQTDGIPTEDGCVGLFESQQQSIDNIPLPDKWLILFTSGTTGDTKPVPLTASNLGSSAVGSAMRLGIDQQDRWLDPLPTYHMGGIAPIIRSVLYGTTVVLQANFEPNHTIRLIENHSVSGISVVPTMLQEILNAGSLPLLRFILCGGAKTPPDLIERCKRRRLPIYPTYGMTEASSQIATATPLEAYRYPEYAGRPLFQMDVKIIQDGESMPAGETGEIVIEGPSVTTGYYNDKQATSKRISEHGFHTGDIGRVTENGMIAVIGRKDRMIVTGGENVHPEEVADVIEGHPDVSAVAVVGIEDEHWGEKVAAAIVGEITEIEVNELCGTKLASYKVPKTVVTVEELPRTASGTVDYSAVREYIRRKE